ncbi:hypothetical protein BDN72DRAFT_833012 [Pluteus cervinus]|uniref:Uncharacterized protein n=1 Tax=Pluteus cervinus TaxID=181527 RepID=A0ACD3B9D7_9AGAR|nr:hypothetical protein BDN72DRAFT_833012 [Pluteus cervinus]
MEEIAEFVNRPEGEIYRGMARIFERVSKDVEGEAETLMSFVSAGRLKGGERA